MLSAFTLQTTPHFITLLGFFFLKHLYIFLTDLHVTFVLSFSGNGLTLLLQCQCA